MKNLYLEVLFSILTMQICSNQFQLIRVVWYALDTALNTTTFIVFKDLLKAILRALLKEASKEERNPTPSRLEDQFKYAMHSI